FGHHDDQCTGIGAPGITTAEVDIDRGTDRCQARLRNLPMRPFRAKTLDNEGRQRLEQSGLAAEAMLWQAAAVTGRLAHLSERHPDRALRRHDLHGRLENAPLRLLSPLRMRASLAPRAALRPDDLRAGFVLRWPRGARRLPL